MSEKRRKSHSILPCVEGKIINILLFESTLWPDERSEEGLYRLKINDKWYTANGKYTFVSFAQAGAIAQQLVNGMQLMEEEQEPYLPVKARVGVYYNNDWHTGHVMAPPHRELDGRWYVHVWLWASVAKVLCNDVKLLRVR